ncbi:MAG: choice-of-anchor L domain-containing protein [Planctomycetota bacterium]
MNHRSTVLALIVAAFFSLSLMAQSRPNLPVGGTNKPVGQTAGGPIVTTDLSGALTATALAESLAGLGVVVSNVSTISDGTNNADLIALGTFSGAGSIIGIESGVILSSGDIATIVGPNTLDNVTTNLSTGSDPDLAVLATAGLQDSTVLQFDFTDASIAPGASAGVQFQFVFASDEYNEFVDSAFNDVFAFFLNGSNIAVLPDLVTPVAINNLNCGNPFDPAHPDDFCNLFNNNDLSDGGPFFDIEADGFSDVLTAVGTVTGPGPHTIKLVIADVSDSNLDSFVFIQASSIVVSADPSCISPTPAVELGAIPLQVLVDAGTAAHEIRAISNNPGETVQLTGVTVTYQAPAGTPVGIPLPLNVSYDSAFPTAGGQPEVLNFVWMPTSAQNPIGTYVFTYSLLDSAGDTSECSVEIEVFECMMLIGLNPVVAQIGGDSNDILRVNPLWLRPMTLSTLPNFYIPNLQSLIGVKFYAQAFVFNASAYPGNALSMSWGLEYTIGSGAVFYGTTTTSNIMAFPAGTGVVNPGDTFTIPFSLAGFGGF